MRYLFALVLLLSACGRAEPTPVPVPTFTPTLIPTPQVTNTPMPTNTPAPQMISVNSVLNSFVAAGIQLTNVITNPTLEVDSPLPRSFDQRAIWHDALLGDKGGQVFICAEASHCQALSAYFTALVAMAGPYLYTSPSGLVVVQLNSGFTPEQATRYQDAIQPY